MILKQQIEFKKLKQNIEAQEEKLPDVNIFGRKKQNEKAHRAAMTKIQKQNYLSQQLQD